MKGEHAGWAKTGFATARAPSPEDEAFRAFAGLTAPPPTQVLVARLARNSSDLGQAGDQWGRGAEPTVGALRRHIAMLLAPTSETAHLDARFLVAHVLGCSAHDLAVLDERPAGRDVIMGALALAERRKAGEPVGRIVGEREFWGLPFRLGSATLEPRPDTETLVEAALSAFADRHDQALTVLDLGTGTGAILLALLSELPRAHGVGVDLAVGAVEIARSNAERLRLLDRASFLVGDWAGAIGAEFDIVVANPPYIPSQEIDSLPLEVRGFDPHLALHGGADGLNAHRAILAELERIVKRDGHAFVEVGAGQLGAVAKLAANHGFAAKGHYDLAGIGRVLEMTPGCADDTWELSSRP